MANKKDRASVDTGEAADQRAATADQIEDAALKNREAEKEAAEAATQQAEEEGRLPANTAGANPAPASAPGSNGVFVEDAMKDAIAKSADHPSVENNPREGTSAVQNGIDWNDPTSRDPADPKFAGQGLDLSVYGKAAEK